MNTTQATVLHHQSDSTPMTIGIDVGGTKIEGILLENNQRILERFQLPSRPGNERVVADIAQIARHLSQTPIPIGIGIPGQVDWQHGIVRNVVNLNIDRINLAEELQAVYPTFVHVENDVNAAALGAAAVMTSGQQTADTLAFLNIGTGLAAGIVCNRHIEHGHSGAIGEIGHIPVDPNRFACPCGQRGCLETVTSGKALRQLWPQAEPPLPDIICQAQRNNEQAQHVLTMILHALADAVQILLQAHDPRLIMIGGGVAKTGQILVDLLADELDKRAESCQFLQGLQIRKRLLLVPSEQPIGAIGAALALN